MNLVEIITSESLNLILENTGFNPLQKLIEGCCKESNFYKKARLLEFLEFIRLNEQIFTIKLIKNECFISGLSLTLNNIVEQFSKQKRFKIYKIFKEFTIEENKEELELEKMYFMLNLLSLNDLKILENINELEKIITSPEMQTEKPEIVNSITSLQSLGILFSIPAMDGANHYQITAFGQKFHNHIFLI